MHKYLPYQVQVSNAVYVYDLPPISYLNIAICFELSNYPFPLASYLVSHRTSPHMFHAMRSQTGSSCEMRCVQRACRIAHLISACVGI
ncbi:hypothetical protein J1614_008912 [Plenodomus biglobosus]|nr:hypothetical protein J1614_008912 [Plenodomus biglobosus]